MTQRSQFQALILEKLGSPLIAAAGGLQPTGGSGLAESLATLLNLSAKTAVAIGKSMQLADEDPQAEPIRLALMAVGSRLLAEQTRLTKQTPGLAENTALTEALDSILKFSESFVDAGARLATLDGQTPADATQIKLQTLAAFTPVVNIVAAAPLSQPPEEFLPALAPKLLARADEMRVTLELGEDKLSTLYLLRALCQLYAACHDEARTLGSATPESVWHAFTTRATILEILGKNLAPVAATNSQASAAPTPPSPPEPAPATAPTAAAPTGNPANPQPGASPANPMSFFKPGAKKPAEDKPPPPPVEPPAGDTKA